MITDSEKLALALDAVEIAEGVMSYCAGDAWEREATANARDRFDDIYARLFPPAPTQSVSLYQGSPYHNPPRPRVKCPECGLGFRGEIGVRDHMRSKHPEATDARDNDRVLHGRKS
jgi:hypothetical protein